MNNNKKKIIVNAKFVEYKDEILVVEFDDGKRGYCERKQISDFVINDVIKYFTKFELYKFKVLKENDDGTYQLSYKYAHPNLVKNKKNIIPTAKHFSTLKKYVNTLLSEYEKEQK